MVFNYFKGMLTGQ